MPWHLIKGITNRKHFQTASPGRHSFCWTGKSPQSDVNKVYGEGALDFSIVAELKQLLNNFNNFSYDNFGCPLQLLCTHLLSLSTLQLCLASASLHIVVADKSQVLLLFLSEWQTAIKWRIIATSFFELTANALLHSANFISCKCYFRDLVNGCFCSFEWTEKHSWYFTQTHTHKNTHTHTHTRTQICI